MAGFEVVVRPVILPDIRPAPPRVLLPSANPDQGVAVINGGSGRLIDLTRSETHSWSRSIMKETKRKFAKERIKKKDDKTGAVDKDTYVDVERLKKVWMVDGNGVFVQARYADPPPRDNVEILQDNQVRNNDG
jgi:hypothetical protein